MTTPNPLADLTVHEVPIGSLTPYDGNARRGNIDAVAESLRVNGQYRPLVVREETGEILAGNHTWQAAKVLGWATVKVTLVSGLDDDAARRIVLVDNRTNDLAGYDEEALAELLAAMEGDYEGTGFDDEAANELIALLDDDEPLGDPEDVPEPPIYEPLTKVGDVWQLGPHRLVVGDSTDAAVVAQACDLGLADMVLTDPPYNVAYDATKWAETETRKNNKSRGGNDTIANDNMSDEAFDAFLEGFYEAAHASTVAGGPIYVFHPVMLTGQFGRAMVEAQWDHKQTLTWVKSMFVLSRQDYHWQTESVLYGWKPGAAHRWYGGFTPATVMEDGAPDFANMSKAELVEHLTGLYENTTAIRSGLDKDGRTYHPTAKPVHLLTRLIENSSRPGDLVLDPFGGSGATLIACHVTKRRCATVELDPRYADVICRRFQQVTGLLPEKDGAPVDFVAHHEHWQATQEGAA